LRSFAGFIFSVFWRDLSHWFAAAALPDIHKHFSKTSFVFLWRFENGRQSKQG